MSKDDIAVEIEKTIADLIGRKDARIAELREALRWYARKRYYGLDGKVAADSADPMELLLDAGRRARVALGDE